jgi:antirestriction protein ArdC
MSLINQFNQLGGAIVTRASLEKIRNSALLEKPSHAKTEILERIDKLLLQHPKADEFELELEKPISKQVQLGKIKIVTKGNELQYFEDKIKLASVNEHGVITYHKQRLPKGLRKKLREDAKIIGLGNPAVECEESVLHGLEYRSIADNLRGLGKPVSPNDIYDYVTKLIVNTIKKVGHLPWQKEWIGLGNEGQAKNYVSKKPYTGANFLLNFDIKNDEKGEAYLVPIKFIQPYYLTFNQIKEAKATLKKDSKAHRVIYYTMIFGFKNESLEIKTSDKSKYSEFITSNGITKEDIALYGSKIPVIKYYNVYRADDCLGLKFDKDKPKKQVSPIETAQSIIDGYPNPPKYTFVGDEAYYLPTKDVVNMPNITAFTKEEFYYCTFFHELIHSTGSEKRLKRFGNEKATKKEYAFEELIAELGAVFLCSEAGILFTTVENSAKYLKGWNSRLVKELENDNRFFLRASAKSQKAADLILDKNDTEKEKKVTKTAKTVTKTAKTVTKKRGKLLSIPTNVTKKVKNDTEIDKKQFPLSIINSQIPLGSKIITIKPYIDARKTGIVKAHQYAKRVVNFEYPFETKVEYADGTSEWVKPWSFKLLPKKAIGTLNKHPKEKQLKLSLGNPIATHQNNIPTELIQIVKTIQPDEAKPNNKLMQMQFDSLPMDEGWEELMQHPAANMKIAIWGPPKNGKTAAALQMANYLTKFGNVLYNFADQGFNLSTQNLWKSSGLANNPGAEPSDISNSYDLEKEIKKGEYKFVFIDMISDYIRTEKIRPEEFKERFIKQFPDVSFILIFEVTKGGNFKGDQGWTHLVDAIMTVEDFLIENRGRYGTGEKIIYEEGFKKFNPKRYAEFHEKNKERQMEEIEFSTDLEII